MSKQLHYQVSFSYKLQVHTHFVGLLSAPIKYEQEAGLVQLSQ